MSHVTILQCELCTFRTPKYQMSDVEVEKVATAHSKQHHQGETVTFRFDTYLDEVQAMEDDDAAPTADLEEFIAAYFMDDNVWWRISCGHHMNLFDAAVERIRELEEALRAHEVRPGQ